MFCHIKVKDAKSVWYLKYQIPSPQKVFGKVFKCPQINTYFVFYLNTSFWVFDQHCFQKTPLTITERLVVVTQCQWWDHAMFSYFGRKKRLKIAEDCVILLLTLDQSLYQVVPLWRSNNSTITSKSHCHSPGATDLSTGDFTRRDVTATFVNGHNPEQRGWSFDSTPYWFTRLPLP